MTEKKYPISLKEVEAEYQELSAKVNFGGSRYLPRIMKKAFTLEQARVALEFDASSEEIASTLGISKEEIDSDVQKYQAEAIAKKLNLDKETVEKHIRYMFEVGFAFPTRRGWRFARSALQIKDSQTNSKFDEQLGDEYFDLWEAFQKTELFPSFYLQSRLVTAGKLGPGWRISPARKSLKNIPYDDIVPEDNIEKLLKLYATLAVEHCPCKRLERGRACRSSTEVCIIMDRVAEHNIRRGAARVISVEEALAIHDMAADAGLVCRPMSYEKKPSTRAMICHCHWCCCDGMTPEVMMNFPISETTAPSCYRAVVDPDKCTGCQTCLTRCQFEAIELIRYPGARRQEKLKAWVNPDKCMGCGLCVIKCPTEARTMIQVKTGESIPEKMEVPSEYTGVPWYRSGVHVETGTVIPEALH